MRLTVTLFPLMTVLATVPQLLDALPTLFTGLLKTKSMAKSLVRPPLRSSIPGVPVSGRSMLKPPLTEAALARVRGLPPGGATRT